MSPRTGIMDVINATVVAAKHPYYPLDSEIVGYLDNESSVLYLLFLFASGCAAILSFTFFMAKLQYPSMGSKEMSITMWFVLSGSIHLFFEGYYAYNYRTLGGLQTLFGQLWKEYAKSDSRYLTQDPFVLCMETFTAVSWGPLCFVVAHLITRQHPLRHPLQIIVSLGQLYGDVLYYATSLFDHYVMGISYSRPEAYYFWGYYVLMNFFWIVIPGLLIYQSVEACADMFRRYGSVEDKASKPIKTPAKRAKKAN